MKKKKTNLLKMIFIILGLFGFILLIFLISFKSFKIVGGLKNLYEGKVIQKEYCEYDELSNGDFYCTPMKAVSDRYTKRAHSISEGTVKSNREIQGGKLLFNINFGSTVIEEIGNRAKHKLKVFIYNYDVEGWEKIIDIEEYGKEIDYVYDLGETLPREGGIVENYGQCTSWYNYKGYDKKSCSYLGYDFSDRHIDPSDRKTIKLKLDMYVEGRHESSNNVVEINGIGAEFIYSKCPECPSPGEWSGCDRGETEERRTNYRCSEETNYECEEYTESRECHSCDIDDDCVGSLQSCFVECINGICRETKPSYPEKPCEDAKWLDYPMCEWDETDCGLEIDWAVLITSVIGVVIVILFSIFFLKRKNII